MVTKPRTQGTKAKPQSTDAADEVYAEQVRVLYENSRQGLTATLVNALLVAFADRDLVPVGTLAAWFGSLGLITGLRFLLLRGFWRAPRAPAEARRWDAYFTAGACASGVLWGAAGFLLFPQESLAHQTFLAFVLGGMVAGAAGAYAARLRAYLAFAVPALLPITVRFLAAGEGLPLLMGEMTLLFFGAMTLVAARTRTMTAASLRLRFENKGLIGVLQSEKVLVAKINEELGAEITERERAEQELQRHRDHLQALVVERTAGLETAYGQLSRAKQEWEKTFDSVPDLIAIVDQDYRIRRLNRAFATRIGVEPRDAIGLQCFEALHGIGAPPTDCPHARLLQDGGAHAGEIYSQKYGQHYLASASPLRGAEGELAGAVLVAHDITDLKEAQADLVAERNRLEVTLESIADAVIATDAEGRVTLLNPVAERLTGWGQEEAVGKPLGELVRTVSEATREAQESLDDRVLRSGESADLGGSILVARDGSERVIVASGSPIRDRDATLIGMALVFRDVTQQRKTEETLARAQHLEALGILAGGIAHDFNNILTGIAANIHQAREVRERGEEGSKYFDRAEDACFRAAGLTQQLLTFARGGEPVREILDVGKVLPEWVEFALRGTNVRADVEVAADLSLLEADERQIHQVLNNLLINAREAMPEGGVMRVAAKNALVAAGTSASLPAGRYVRIFVEDRGVGIAAEHLSKIFDPYFTTKASGSGLGLAMAYSIVKRHGGDIEAQSQRGLGSTFSVYLPASEEPSPALGPALTPTTPRGSGRLLVMDDEEAIREILAEILPELGYEVEFTAEGTEAVERYRRAVDEGYPFDGVILDLIIPGGIGGIEVLKELRAIDGSVKAIASSGYAADPVLSDPARFGFAGMLAKPYRVSELAYVLHRVLAAGG
jgi:PAS domain S-box-containing protein